MKGAKQAEVSKDYQFEKIKPEIVKFINTVVINKCRNIGQYDPKLGQQWSNEIAESHSCHQVRGSFATSRSHQPVVKVQ